MHIAIITAGGAGMYCGSCMHDNTWAHALMEAGAEVSLIPTYTPIRVDEANESLERIFFGGINVYLNGKFGFWKYMPKLMTKWLDSPRIIHWATRKSVSNNANELGSLTLSMLQGENGPHQRAGEELADFLGNQLKPDVVIFSNALLAGALHAIKHNFSGPVLCVLQGDDVFLDSLPDEFRRPIMELLKKKAREFDGILVHSQFYRDYMASYLDLPLDMFEILPLGIDMTGHHGGPDDPQQDQFTIGYFARIAPEKGLHYLTQAFSRLKQDLPQARLKVGGYLGSQHRDYFEKAWAPLKQFGEDAMYIGSPDLLADKVAFLRNVDVLSVPTDFLEPKGLYVLEALANGVPVVQPQHGAFPEILAATNGGVLVPPKDANQLASALKQMSQVDQRMPFAHAGWTNVRTLYSAEAMAKRTIEILKNFEHQTF